MAKTDILYIEHKSNQDNKGLAWIARIEYSKSGQTIYFNGQALKKLKSPQGEGNYYDLISNDISWVSGVKTDGSDRHWLGSGKIGIDKTVVNEYLSLVKRDKLDPSKFELVEIEFTDKKQFETIENHSHD